jgi:hypothetical protein
LARRAATEHPFPAAADRIPNPSVKQLARQLAEFDLPSCCAGTLRLCRIRTKEFLSGLRAPQVLIVFRRDLTLRKLAKKLAQLQSSVRVLVHFDGQGNVERRPAGAIGRRREAFT